MIFLNTGSNHHVGPNRLYVSLARRLAAEGHPSLRFGVSGIGDSPAFPGRPENRVYSAASIADVGIAIAEVERRLGASRCVLLGFCSGAYLAFHGAVEDPRVAGLVLINQQTFFWTEGDSLVTAVRKSAKSTSFYKRAIFEPATWERVMSGRIDLGLIAEVLATRLKTRLGQRLLALRTFVRVGRYEHSDIARKFLAFTDRGAAILLVYSAIDGGLDVIDEHLGENARKLRGRPGFRMEVIDGPDHTFTATSSHARLLELVSTHLASAFGSS